MVDTMQTTNPLSGKQLYTNKEKQQVMIHKKSNRRDHEGGFWGFSSHRIETVHGEDVNVQTATTLSFSAYTLSDVHGVTSLWCI